MPTAARRTGGCQADERKQSKRSRLRMQGPPTSACRQGAGVLPSCWIVGDHGGIIKTGPARSLESNFIF